MAVGISLDVIGRGLGPKTLYQKTAKENVDETG
jgi:hypothetical protein